MCRKSEVAVGDSAIKCKCFLLFIEPPILRIKCTHLKIKPTSIFEQKKNNNKLPYRPSSML